MHLDLLPCLALSVLLILIPGPDTAVVTKNALLGGHRSGMLAAVGVSLGLTVWTLAAALGIAALLKASAVAFLVLKLAGAVYLAWIGIQMLRARTGLDELVPVHRLDRDTAGLVLFSVRPETRARYFALFREGRVHKGYEAIGRPSTQPGDRWHIESRIAQGEPWFTYREVEGPINAVSDITLVERRQERALYRLQPKTGKTHQLRLHLARIGAHIENDPLYPSIRPRDEAPDHARPMQLLAKELAFDDPVSGRAHRWRSPRSLQW